MSIIELTKLFSEITGSKIYALKFPDNIKTDLIKMEITSSTDLGAGVFEVDMEIMCKSLRPERAEGLAIDLNKKLNGLTDKSLKDNSLQLILCQGTTPQPFFLGETEAKEFIFTASFRALVNK